jgi:hypothetical protein
MSGSSPGRALAATAPSFEVVFIDETGTQRREPLSACWDVPFERAKPSRSFPSFKGQKNFPGLWWSATMGEHVGYESWVERDVAMLLDSDPEIVGFSAQPFWLLWSGERGERKHAPDFFARRTDGTGVVIDVRPDDRVDPEAAEVFEVAASACSEAGREFRRTGAPPAVLTANVRWLAGYRNPRCHRPEIADALIERFAAPMPLFTGAAAVGDRLVVLPVLYHLLWRQVLVVDLAAAPLSPGSLIHLAAAAR